jgi:hypothetical protein
MNEVLVKRFNPSPSMEPGSWPARSPKVRRPRVARGLLARLLNSPPRIATSTISDIPLPAVSKAPSQVKTECAIRSRLAADFAADLALYDKLVGELMETHPLEEVIKGAKPLFDCCVRARTRLQWHQLEHCC